MSNDRTSAEVAAENERVRRMWDKTAPRYDKKISFWERRLFAGSREWVCSQAKGDVLEVAIGTGRNLEYYPPDVRLTGVEFSPAMLEVARQKAEDFGLQADRRIGDAQALEFPDDPFDTVVVTIALCSIPDDQRAISEMKRVLRAGGRLVMFEHVGSSNRFIRGGQRVLEFFTIRLEGDYLTRQPIRPLRAEGFDLETVERSKAGIVERVVARKPA